MSTISTMKKTLAAFVTVLFITSSFPLPANAAAKAGGVCPALGKVITISGNKLICSKSGSKLNWTASANVTTYATGPTGRMVYRIVRDRQERLSSANDWLKSDVRKEADFDPIRAAAYKSISGLAIDSKLTNIEFEFFIQASYPKEVGRVLKAQSIKIATKFSPLLDTKIKLKLILVTEKDQSFIDGELKQIVPNVDFTGSLQNLSSYGSLRDFYSRAGTGGGTAGYLPESKTGYYLGHTSSLATLKTFWPQVAPHEMAHVLQGVLAGGFEGNGYGEGDLRAKWHGHLIEGSANTIGMALGFENLGWYSDEMDSILRTSITNKVVKSRYPMKTITDAVLLMKEIEKRESGYKETLSYSAGQIIWEYFIGKYGFDKFVELLKNVPLTESFDENLEKTIGLNRDEFYEAAAPYLLATWKRLS